MPTAYCSEVIALVDPIPLGMVVQSVAVKSAGSIEALQYWDFADGSWTKEYAPECLLRATREVASGVDSHSQTLPIPLDALATAGVIAKVYALDASGGRTQLREAFNRPQLAYLAGIVR